MVRDQTYDFSPFKFIESCFMAQHVVYPVRCVVEKNSQLLLGRVYYRCPVKLVDGLFRFLCPCWFCLVVPLFSEHGVLKSPPLLNFMSLSLIPCITLIIFLTKPSPFPLWEQQQQGIEKVNGEIMSEKIWLSEQAVL